MLNQEGGSPAKADALRGSAVLPAVMLAHTQALMRKQVRGEGLLSCQASYNILGPGRCSLLAALLL